MLFSSVTIRECLIKEKAEFDREYKFVFLEPDHAGELNFFPN